MAVVNLLPPAYAFNSAASAYGSNFWGMISGGVASSIPNAQGAAWAYWKMQASGIPAGQAFNGFNVQANIDFTVGAGGAGISRASSLYVLGLPHTGFGGASGVAISGAPGTGAGQVVNAVYQPAGFTSSDLLNGTMYLGVAVSTTGADAGLGNGIFRYVPTNIILYTGADTPTPPAGNISGTLTNPAANNFPGAFPGSTLAALTFVYAQPKPDAVATAFFSIVGTTKLTFTGNPTVSLDCSSGHGYTCTTPLINIAADCPPGVYQISMQVNNATSPTYVVWTTVVVRQSGGMPFMEV